MGGMALAQLPPDQVNYQGVLRNADNLPRTGAFDMIFRFFDSQTGGNEILVDSHLASGTGAVVATDGLFSVPLGGGTVVDGASVFPNDPYTTLTKMFGDFSSVWLQIEIDSGMVVEVLSPRVAVRSSPYSLNYGGRRVTFLKDVEASGVNGQAGNVGSYAAVALNVQEGDTSFCSLFGSQFTLQPGKYAIRGAVTFFKAGSSGTTTYSGKSRIWNVTDGEETIIGSSVWVAHDNFGYTDSSNSIVNGVLSIETATTFELQYRTSHANLFIGRAVTYGNDEVYSQLEIERLGEVVP